jgi:hypothetical protein
VGVDPPPPPPHAAKTAIETPVNSKRTFMVKYPFFVSIPLF